MRQRNIKVPRAFPSVIERLYSVPYPTRYVRDLLKTLESFPTNTDTTYEALALKDSPYVRPRSFTHQSGITDDSGYEVFRLNFSEADTPLVDFADRFISAPGDHLPDDHRWATCHDAFSVHDFGTLVTFLIYIDVCNKLYVPVEEVLESLSTYLDKPLADRGGRAYAKKRSSDPDSAPAMADVHIKFGEKWAITFTAQKTLSSIVNKSSFVKWLIRRDIALANGWPEPQSQGVDLMGKAENCNGVHLSLRGAHNNDIRAWLSQRRWLTGDSYAQKYLGEYPSMSQSGVSYYVAALIKAYADGADKPRRRLKDMCVDLKAE